MKKSLTVELDEKDVEKAIIEYVKKYQDLDVKEISMSTSVRGDYDRGDAVQYVEKVWCECEH